MCIRDSPKAVVWLVPSDAILSQTYKTLTDKNHAYRKKIDVDFGGFRFQPSELAKIVLILFFARFFSKYAENLNTVKTIGLSLSLIHI